jgi:poly(beta-D-mannuronate) lyase
LSSPTRLPLLLLSASLIAACNPLPDDTEESSQSSTWSGGYLVRGVQSNRCAGVEGGSTLDGAKIWQWDCDGRSSETWQLHDLGGEIYEVKSVAGKCLDVSGASLLDGASAIQWTCKQSTNQKWKVIAAGTGVYQLQAVHSGKCLEVAGGSTANGAYLQQQSCRSVDQQRFKLLSLTPAKVAVAGAAVTASSNDGNVPANTVDGSLATRWSASGDGQWIQYALGGSRRVSYLRLAGFGGSTRTFKLDIQTSVDGVSWTTRAAGVTTALTDALQTLDFPDVDPAAYVRIVGHGSSTSAWNSYTEVEIWGGVSLVSGGAGCTAESDGALCLRLGKNCGTVTAADNCGAARTVTCGACVAPQTCGGGGTANVCGGVACTPETDATFCLRLGKTCGSVTGADNCGTTRTVACGTCPSGQTCSTSNVCSCTPETNATFCSRLAKNCGSVTATDNCGAPRTVTSCGSCTSPQTCGGAGTANVCGTPPEETLPACKRTVKVATSATLASAIGGALAGDCIVLADGDYTFPAIKAKGTAAAPIVISAANLLKATVSSGNLTYDSAAYVVVSGLAWSGGPLKMSNCDHCRLSRSRLQVIEPATGTDWITVSGTSNYCRIDHNDLGPKLIIGNMIMLSGSGSQVVQNTRIDHNFFHDVMGGGGNGWETIRAGLSGWTFSIAHTVIELNLFLHTTGDPETISVKSSENTIRYNTLRASQGEFTLRHGNRSSVYGNYILGDGVSGSGGIRVLGQDHKIYNNYIQGISGTGIFLEGGESDDTTGMLTDHKQVYRAQVVFNTVVNARIAVGGSHPLEPVDCKVAYNVLQGTGGTVLNEVTGTTGTFYKGNIVWNGSTNVTGTDAVRKIDPKLVKVGEIFKLGSVSPAINTADATFTFVTDDMDGQARSTPDVGADELSSATPKRGLLSATDVGPNAP